MRDDVRIQYNHSKNIRDRRRRWFVGENNRTLSLISSNFSSVWFLGLKKNKPAFLGHIGNGLDNLLIAVDKVGGLELLNDLAMECQTILAGKKY
jgi:hypothetical protein